MGFKTLNTCCSLCRYVTRLSLRFINGPFSSASSGGGTSFSLVSSLLLSSSSGDFRGGPPFEASAIRASRISQVSFFLCWVLFLWGCCFFLSLSLSLCHRSEKKFFIYFILFLFFAIFFFLQLWWSHTAKWQMNNCQSYIWLATTSHTTTQFVFRM